MIAWIITRRAWSEFSDDNCRRMAAALAYYAAFSLPSILLIVFFLIGLVFGRAAVEGQLQRQIGSALGVRIASLAQEVVRSMAEHANGGVIACILGLPGNALLTHKARPSRGS